MLGAGHTGGRGTHASMASGATRTGYLVRLVDLRGPSTSRGSRSSQRSQYDKFMSLTKGTWSAYPGNQAGATTLDAHISIIWRSSEWELLQAKTLAGHPVLQRQERCRCRTCSCATSRTNGSRGSPTSTTRRRGERCGNQAKWRAQGAAMEIALANQLWESGVPLGILTGDMKEAVVCTSAR